MRKRRYEVDDILYYYLRDPENRPVVTVCLVRNGDEYARGVAICSPYEMPIKAKGRTDARKRALAALFNKWFVEPINRDEAVYTLSLVDECELLDTLELKSEYDPSLTKFEKRLFDIPIQGCGCGGCCTS